MPDNPIAGRELDPRHCKAISMKTGAQCRAFPVSGEPYCAGHLGLGKLDPYRAAARSAEVRQATAQERKRTPQDAFRAVAIRNAEALAEQLAHDALHADTASERTRANEALMSRVFGKPKETVETVEKPLALQAIEEMTSEELDEAWRRLEAMED